MSAPNFTKGANFMTWKLLRTNLLSGVKLNIFNYNFARIEKSFNVYIN